MALWTIALAVGVTATACAADEGPCGQLRTLTLPAASTTRAEVVAAGTLTEASPEFSRPESAFYKLLPAFCRVSAAARPTPDSDIRIEVWLPVSGWNGRLQAQGNGGFVGAIEYRPLGVAIRRGYAAATTDTGHTGSPVDASWAPRHPEKVIDFGYRGVHEMTRVARAGMLRKFSNDGRGGGRSGNAQAQRTRALEWQ